VLPPLVVGVGALMAAVWIRRRRPAATASESGAAPTVAIDDEAREPLEEELRRVSG